MTTLGETHVPMFILATQSPRRHALMRLNGFRFDVVPSHAAELDASGEDLEHVVMENARIKGREVARRAEIQREYAGGNAVLVAADTLVRMGRQVFGKPRDWTQARDFLKQLGGRSHEVLTGVYLRLMNSGVEHVFLESTRVVLRRLTDREIQALFERVDPCDKAAGYGYQDAPEIVAEIDGSQTNVIGLPMTRLRIELKQLLSKQPKREDRP